MKTIRHLPGMALILGGFVLVFAALPSQGQILRPRTEAAATIAISPDQPLAFGSLTTTTGGSVTIDPLGIITPNGVIPLGLGSSPARFTVTTDGGNPHYTITLPTSATLTAPGGATMRVDGFQSNPALTGITKPPARTDTLNVGATLHVAANQNPGQYTGTFNVIVNLGN